MNFVSAQLPDNEERRAEAVERTGLIDSNQASLFNIYCELAKDITGYEAVLFQLFDSKERCYLAEIQPEINKTQNLNTRRPKDGSVCAHVLLDTKPLIAFDVTKHEITKTHSNEKGVKSYIGFPIIDKNNLVTRISTLILKDKYPIKTSLLIKYKYFASFHGN